MSEYHGSDWSLNEFQETVLKLYQLKMIYALNNCMHMVKADMMSSQQTQDTEPLSTTLDKHRTSAGSVSRVFWDDSCDNNNDDRNEMI